MKNYLIILLIFLLASFQGAFLKINLVLLLVIFLAAYRPVKESLWLAFIAGLFLDLAKGLPLGFSSFLLLITDYLLLVYSRRFDSRHPVFLAVFAFLTSGLMNFLTSKNFALTTAMILAIFALITRLVFKVLLLEPEEVFKLKV